jgi:hypothetical protein
MLNAAEMKGEWLTYKTSVRVGINEMKVKVLPCLFLLHCTPSEQSSTATHNTEPIQQRQLYYSIGHLMTLSVARIWQGDKLARILKETVMA